MKDAQDSRGVSEDALNKLGPMDALSWPHRYPEVSILGSLRINQGR